MSTVTTPPQQVSPLRTPRVRVRGRRTPLAARGEPAVWIMGAALTLCTVMIVGLVAMIVAQGMATFWPGRIDLVTLRSGEIIMGAPVRDEGYDAPRPVLEEVARLRSESALIEGALTSDGRPVRRLYRVGNKDVGQEPFRWVPLHEILRVEQPRDAVLLERREWGIWLGRAQAVLTQKDVTMPAGADVVPEEVVASDEGRVRIAREILREEDDGSRVVRVRRFLAEGDDAWKAFRQAHPEAKRRADRITSIREHDIGRLNAREERWRQRERAAEFEVERARTRPPPMLSQAGWGALLAATLAALCGGGLAAWRTGRQRDRRAARGMRAVCAVLLCAAPVGLLGLALEHPWAGVKSAEARLARVRVDAAAARERLAQENEQIRAMLRALEAEDEEYRGIFEDATGSTFAPKRMTERDEPLVLSQVVRAVPSNTLGALDRLGVYLSRWWEFVSENPRESNTEGGVLPVIVGTVLLTILLSVAVVPLGVIAALYLREYAKQGVVTSIVRIAVNNLAGVPSIVYGVFGLGFFCYALGGYVDAGPDPDAVLPRGGAGSWWFIVTGGAVVVFGAIALGMLARPKPGTDPTAGQRWLRRLAIGLWFASAGLVAAAIATTPYFTGFYRANLPNPTFGGRGLLWASLTLALLTLPVVIVATEEAITAVPRSMREGSYGCGASKWQTIKRIVLPGAMPGIMTGMILAMARGAGEVAPLMLVGAVKKADDLPFSTEAPFIHLERAFMHLGFHIYDLGFQSPDSEAARPLVWTTTLLLIAIVVLLNLAAIAIRARLRARLRHGHF